MDHYADHLAELTADLRKVAEERDVEGLPGFPHGMPTTEADTINADLLAFLK